DGGGHGAIACDVAATAGLELPLLSAELAEHLAGSLPHTAATRNPVDLAGGGEQDFFSYARVARAVLESGEVDAALLTGYFGGYCGARGLLQAAGIEFVAARSVAADGDLEAAAAELGYPVVVKALGTLHKSDVGGVIVGIGGPDELRATVAELRRRLDPPGFS